MNKQDWTYKKLGEVCEKASSNIAQNKIANLDGDYPVFGASGFVQNVDFYHRETPYIGIVKDGSGVGRVNIYPAYSSLLGTMQYIIPKEGNLLGYIAYALKGLNLSSFASGAAIPHIYFKDYSKCKIPVPPLAEQERIVAELDLLQGIIEKKKEQLKAYDQLAQSIFYTMFGDPIDNPKGWEVKKMEDCFIIGSGGTPSKAVPDYWEGGDIPWIGSNMCQNCIIEKTDGKFITEDGLNHSSAKMVESGTVLVALVGATIGKVALLKTNTAINQNIAFIKLKKPKSFIPEFVYYHLMGQYDEFMNIGDGKFKMANQAFIKALSICLPPLSLQQEFAEKVEAIERQKALVQQSIVETQTMFDYAMDKYFG